jgi:hypothetical protein
MVVKNSTYLPTYVHRHYYLHLYTTPTKDYLKVRLVKHSLGKVRLNRRQFSYIHVHVHANEVVSKKIVEVSKKWEWSHEAVMSFS